MTVRVLNPGLSTTVQDLGRPGYFHLGIPIGGAMDRLALRAGNLLVGNDEGAAGLEAVFVGPQLEFTRDALIAVTGAEMPVKIDGEEQPSWTALKVKAGQVLSFGFLKTGARIYITIAGGIDVPVALGSRSTYPIGALGGYKGRAIAKDDELPVGMAAGAKEGRQLPETLRRRPGKPAELRVLPGLYWHRVVEQSQKNFFDDDWKVAPEADRMDIASAAAGRCPSWSASSLSARGRSRRTSSTAVIPTARSRFRAVPSLSSCTATRSQAAATSWSAPSSRRTWT